MTEQDYRNLLEENKKLRESIEWYKRTYEHRSLAGIHKDRIVKKASKTHHRFWNSLIESEFVQHRHILTYLLEYLRDFGIIRFSAAAIRTIRTNGIRSLLHIRRTIQPKLKPRFNFNTSYNPKVHSAFDESELRSDIKKFASSPKISFILPTYNTRPDLLKIAIDSITNQIYSNWELCIADDCSTKEDTRKLLKEFARNDRRIKVTFLEKNSGISEASNAALRLAEGEFIALMDHDDEITPDALYWIVKELNAHNKADIIYTDECKANEAGDLSDFFLKPDWSPELMLNMMYVGHLTVYRKKLLDEVGFFRKEYDYSQDYDLMLRAVEKARDIRHVKRVLYHWRMTEGSAAQGDKPFARHTNLAALGDAMKRRKIEADILELPTANRAKLRVNQLTSVSIIIPTDSYDNLKASIESIVQGTTYLNYEIVAVTNSKLIERMNEELALPNLVYAPYDKPYNFSDKCNHGARKASGEIVIFFNDDVRPLQNDWIENTIEFLFIPGVGGVSPKLIYENDTIQYAGMAAGVRNLIGTTFHCYHRDSGNYINFAQLVRNVSILSGACQAMRKSLFLELGGFDPVNTPSSHSDVDISFKILEKGLRCVYTPYAVLRHIGHLSLGEYEIKQPKKGKDKADIFLLKKWSKYLSEDSYFTDPMRTLVYHDSPEPYKIYSPTHSGNIGSKGDVLLVSHDLSRSGAPIMLYDLCKVLISEGYFVVVTCPSDGAVREVFQQIGVTVIIDELLLRQHESFTRFAKNFDFVICNTIVTWPVVKQLNGIVETIWWVHEGQVMDLFTGNSECVETIRHAKNIIGVSDYSIAYLNRYTSDVTKIYNACQDIGTKSNVSVPSKANSGKLIFSIIGSIESRKGHDILIDALQHVNPDLLERMELRIIGRTLDPAFKTQIHEKIKNKKFIRFVGEATHAECLELLRQTDVVLCTSRDDPFPVVLVEAFCMSKLCVVSSNTGVAELIKQGKNGFVFKSEDPKSLAEVLTVILKMQNIQEIGNLARNIYDKHLSLNDFKHAWRQYIQSVSKANALQEKNN